MKNFLIFITLILLSIYLFNSCHSEGRPQEEAGVTPDNNIDKKSDIIPKPVNVYPSNNSIGLSHNTLIETMFNVLMNDDTINEITYYAIEDQNFTDEKIDAVIYKAYGSTYRLKPLSPLNYYSRYTYKLIGGEHGISSKNKVFMEKSYEYFFSTGHEITIDGQNDFESSIEEFNTTSNNYKVFLAYDSTNIFVGLEGDDINSGNSLIWAFIYIDNDINTNNGVMQGHQYNTQTFELPFYADYYLRWRADNQFLDVMYYDNQWNSFSDIGETNAFQNGEFLEINIPTSLIGNSEEYNIVVYMINEASGSEWTYSGAPYNTFTDGYANPMSFNSYIRLDLTGISTNINDSSNIITK